MTDTARPADPSAEAPDGLREYCLRFVRFLASTALDPHRYFEQKYAGDVKQAITRRELIAIMTTLLDWLDTITVNESSLSAFDAAAQADQLPSLTMLHDAQTREAGLILAGGHIDSSTDADIVRQFAEAAPSGSPDRLLAERRLSDYAHR